MNISQVFNSKIIYGEPGCDLHYANELKAIWKKFQHAFDIFPASVELHIDESGLFYLLKHSMRHKNGKIKTITLKIEINEKINKQTEITLILWNDK